MPKLVPYELMGIEGDPLVNVVTSIYTSKDRIILSNMSKMFRTACVVSGRPRTVSILKREIGTTILDHFDRPMIQLIR